jgi:hypothetical protein
MAVLAKAGYAARGFIYVVIGVLALMEAFGSSGETGGSKNAIREMFEFPGGLILLWVIALGLIGYSVWRFVQSVLDADDHGTDMKGLVIRAGLFVSSVTHIALAGYAIYVAVNYGAADSESGQSGSQGMVQAMLGWPAGRWIVGFVGLCIIGAGVAHAMKAHKEKFRKRFVIEAEKMQKIKWICIVGLYARGIAFLIIGGMFLYAAWTQNPDNAGGLKEVFATLTEQSYGTVLLAAMAIGLLCFGLYSIFESLYRKVDGPG